jgi:hypothetical protein
MLSTHSTLRIRSIGARVVRCGGPPRYRHVERLAVAAATALRDQPAHVRQGLGGRIIFNRGIGARKYRVTLVATAVKISAATLDTVRESSARLYTGHDPLMMMSIGAAKGSSLISGNLQPILRACLGSSNLLCWGRHLRIENAGMGIYQGG